jgi:hypothetical protein
MIPVVAVGVLLQDGAVMLLLVAGRAEVVVQVVLHSVCGFHHVVVVLVNAHPL